MWQPRSPTKPLIRHQSETCVPNSGSPELWRWRAGERRSGAYAPPGRSTGWPHKVRHDWGSVGLAPRRRIGSRRRMAEGEELGSNIL